MHRPRERASVSGAAKRSPGRGRLADLRDGHCRRSRDEMIRELTGTWREEHLLDLGIPLRMHDDITARIEDQAFPRLSEAGSEPGSLGGQAAQEEEAGGRRAAGAQRAHSRRVHHQAQQDRPRSVLQVHRLPQGERSGRLRHGQEGGHLRLQPRQVRCPVCVRGTRRLRGKAQDKAGRAPHDERQESRIPVDAGRLDRDRVALPLRNEHTPSATFGIPGSYGPLATGASAPSSAWPRIRTYHRRFQSPYTRVRRSALRAGNAFTEATAMPD